MKVFAWDETTRLLIDINGRELREDVLNGGFLPHADNETPDKPLEQGSNQINRRVGGQEGSWELIADYRGCVFYDKSTKAQHVITEAGIEPDAGWTSKVPRQESYYIFSESEGDWVFDLALYKTYQTSIMSNQSFSVAESLFPEYKIRNIERNICSYEAPLTAENHRATSQACRNEFYRIKALIEVAVDKDDVDSAVAEANWPKAIVVAA